jgi:hypothetical protein
MVTLTEEALRAAYARNACAKMFGGGPRDWVRIAIETAAGLSGMPHLQVSDEMIDVAIRESRLASETAEGGVLDWTRAGLEAAMELMSSPTVVAQAPSDRNTMWLVVYWPQVGDEMADSVWTLEDDARNEAQRLNDELGPGYRHYGHRPIARDRPRDPAHEGEPA